MKSRVFRATLQALLAVSVLGASLAIRADEATADLQAGIDAFNRGDLPGAMTLYEKAAEAGSPEAQVRLAYLLDYAEDNEEAVHWYRAAADQEYADGIAGLAAMYAKGEGVAQDQNKARVLFEKAGEAEAGHAGSIRVLISAYEKGGLDVEKDATRAAYWKDKQASLGSNGN
jgi:TPR repeat protein